MTTLSFNALSLELAPRESVLDCLLRHGQPIPYSCKSGMCQACLVRALSDAPEAARAGLKPALRESGCVLACQWRPEGDAVVAAVDPRAFTVAARIRELVPLNAQVFKVLLEPVDPAAMFTSRPGQYLTITNPDGIVRSYSLANDYERDGVLELHIGATTHGLFTHWLFDNARAGDVVYLRGPAGECYYDPREVDAATTPLLLAGTGTGLAPLYGIAHDALRRGHHGPILLFHGGHAPDRLYYVDALRELAGAHANFHYYPCVREAPTPTPMPDAAVHVGSIESVMESVLDADAAARALAYLAGAPSVVLLLRKKLFLKGLRRNRIHADPFAERFVQAS
jgi:NAD(P)H-flavin reductase/ferredoxin